MSKKYIIDGVEIYSHYEPRKFDWELVLGVSLLAFVVICSFLILWVYRDLPELISVI